MNCRSKAVWGQILNEVAFDLFFIMPPTVLFNAKFQPMIFCEMSCKSCGKGQLISKRTFWWCHRLDQKTFFKDFSPGLQKEFKSKNSIYNYVQ